MDENKIEEEMEKRDQEAAAMAEKNKTIADWRRDSEGLADLLETLDESAYGREIVLAWMFAHPDIDPPVPANALVG